MNIFSNDYFRLYVVDINVYIEVFKLGYNIKDFSSVGALLPRLKLTNYGALQTALAVPAAPVIVGLYKPRLEIEISKDKLEATIKLNLTEEEYQNTKRDIVKEAITALQDAGIVHGIIKDVLMGEISTTQKTVIAKGVEPIEGVDAIVRYFAFGDKKPETKIDGSVNHYELHLIDNVLRGDWLGEKTPCTEGVPGISVTGEPIPAKPGRDTPIKYDKKTVISMVEGDKEVLRAAQDGAVKIHDGRIMVDNHMIITGDVDFTTGNIDFQGFVSVNGTVQDGFIVRASQDITINGPMGVGAVGLIESTSGSVYIKGGINGKNTAIIRAAKNVFLKYAKEVTVEAKDSINIGFYAMESILKAGKVFVSNEGKLIGGEVIAEHQIVAGTIGNMSERKTVIQVKGFERNDIKFELDAILINYKDMLTKANKLKRQLEIFETNIDKLDTIALNTYRALSLNYDNLIDDIIRLNSKVETLQEILKTKGDGEIKITKYAYPKTMLEIKTMQKRIKDTISGSFYVKDREMFFEE